MLEGVVPFPRDVAARYRAKGYWRGRSLAEEFAAVSARHAERVAVVDRGRSVTYAELDRASTNLALNLLELGLKPLDRVVVQLPNVAEFVTLYFALQKIGCIPIAAPVTHRYREIAQFAALSGAVACVTPDRGRDFEFPPMIARIRAENPALRHGIVLGAAPAGFASLADLIERPSRRAPADLAAIRIDPEDPAVFQLSGGTTGMGAGLPGGMGARIRHAHPSSIDDLAADFPNLTIVAAHPGWPWVDETTAVLLHKGNVYWEMSGWAPKYLPEQLKKDIRGRLQDKVMFGSDYPSMPYERIFREWDELGYSTKTMEKLFHANAERVLGL